MPLTQAPSLAGLTAKKVAVKIALLTVVGAVFGWVYALVAPSMFPPEAEAGFGRGIVHGALMPMALPSLLMGKEVEIYAPRNSGRAYKLGYIVGINACGLIFFGSAFWRPSSRTQPGRPQVT